MSTKRPGPSPVAGLAAIFVFIAVGCTGASHGAPPVRNSTGGTTGPPTTGVPNPFTVVATYSATSLGLMNPRGLAVGPDGNLYVTDATDRVTVVSPGGAVIRRFGGPGKGPGQFSFITEDARDPTDVAASIAVGPDGRVYVSDSGNGRVEVFTPTGKFVRQVGSLGINVGQFDLPRDLVVDPDGDLYVVDRTFGTVSKFSSTGKFIWQIGGVAAPDPQLRGYLSLASVDSHGRVVTSNDQESILYIDGNGHKVDSFHTDFGAQVGPCNVTVDPAGYTFVTSCGGKYTIGECGIPGYAACHPFELVYDRTHRLVGAWDGSPFLLSPRFGPNGEVFTLAKDGSILDLKVTLPGA